MLVLTQGEVAELLDLDDLIDALAGAMVDLSAGRASMPPRGAANVADQGAMLASMPAYLPTAGALTTKLVSLFPHNRDRPTHQAVICCFDPVTGTPLALMDGTHITATRTAAGSVLAARHLAREGASAVTVIGTGVQARAHALAYRSWPGLVGIRVAGRDQAAAARLVDDLARQGVPGELAPSIEGAVRAGDIVCAATHAADPVVLGEWVRPGTFVSSVGYNTAGAGEVDEALVASASIVVESRAAALAPPPSGAVELRNAVERGVVAAEQIREIGEVIAEAAPRAAEGESPLLYKSVGVAVQDAAAAALVLAAASRSGAGTTVDLA